TYDYWGRGRGGGINWETGAQRRLFWAREQLAHSMEVKQILASDSPGDFDQAPKDSACASEMQKDMDEKMDVLINIQKNSKFPFRRGLKMQQDLRLIGKTDTDLQLPLRKMDGAGRAPLSLQKKMVALQQPKDPMDSLHRCDSCFEKRLLCTPQNSYDQGKVPYHAWASFSPLASGPAF
ncbi:hypothetical protein FD755_011341, partial [Muntiacus reevesi]